MGADFVLLGVIGLLAGASTLAIVKSRNSQRRNWIAEMEDERRRKRFHQTKPLLED